MPNSGSLSVPTRWGLSAIISFLEQGGMYAISLITGGGVSAPHGVFTLDPYWQGIIVNILSRLMPSLSIWGPLPGVVNWVAGWIALGSIFFVILILFGKVFKFALAMVIGAALLAFLLVVVFRLPLPALPTNSTLPGNSTAP